ncbi:MAG: glycosyltransferase [Alistipes sp.]|jgi:glycosyltransferase involved in cell wall biosynthesis|nr:glycosyltransferase [Alistipes sp.]
MISISIIIATYNRGERLLRTLRSVVSQTLPAEEWEVVAVNNNSTDDTAEVFARFATEHPGFNLRMVFEPKQGLSHARNCGIAAARGEIIAIIDDDEEVNAEFAASYVDFFARHPEVPMAGGGVVPVYETDRPRWMSRFTERPIAGTLDLGPREKPFAKGYPAGGNMAVRRAAFERLGVFDTSLGRTGAALIGGEEKELFMRVVADGGSAWWVPGAVINHIIPPSKLTSDYFRRLSRGVGASERVRTRAISRAAYVGAVVKEVAKWGATIAIALWFALSLCPSKALYLIIMRVGITAGLLR